MLKTQCSCILLLLDQEPTVSNRMRQGGDRSVPKIQLFGLAAGIVGHVTLLEFADVVHEVGFPPGVINSFDLDFYLFYFYYGRPKDYYGLMYTNFLQ